MRQLQRSVVLIAVFALVVTLAGLVEPNQPTAGNQFAPPSSAHFLGTDQFGRDVFIRLIAGGQRSLISAMIASAIGFTLGVLMGALSGGLGGWIDGFLMRGIDVLLAMPGILIAMVLVAGFGVGLEPISLGVGISLVPSVARFTRATVNSAKSAPYVEAAKSLGADSLWITIRHLVPNILPQLLPFGGVIFAWAMLSISGLEYLGLAGSPSDASWGRMIAEGRNYLYDAPWLVLAPGISVLLTTFAAMTLGNSANSV